ncbi:hypothetical protein BgiMline_011804, partial [Biomphalaria glabrata]
FTHWWSLSTLAYYVKTWVSYKYQTLTVEHQEAASRRLLYTSAGTVLGYLYIYHYLKLEAP